MEIKDLSLDGKSALAALIRTHAVEGFHIDERVDVSPPIVSEKDSYVYYGSIAVSYRFVKEGT